MSTPNSSGSTKKRVVVLGAGVIGLTTALKLQETGKYDVQIVAEVLPSDPKTIKYTSHWAGAYHVIDEEAGTPGEALQKKTFDEMWSLSAPGSPAEHCFLRCKHTHYFAAEQERPHLLERMPNFQPVPKDELPAGIHTGFSFESVTIDVPVYLKYLLQQFLAKGGSVDLKQIEHIDKLLDGPDAVVVCTGLGSRTLGGMEDLDVYPARGQTVILEAPWVRNLKVLENLKDGKWTWTYIIPRKSGDVVVGGTKEANDWESKPRPETTTDILRRALAICPELASPETRDKLQGAAPAVEDVLPLVKEEAVGLRPMRKGGPRIELESRKGPSGKDIPVVLNYGHGAEGYIKSIGSAYAALQLLEGALSNMSGTSVKHITVLGAGVIGLTTALKIQKKGGYQVTILAEHFPTDPKNIKYASHFAGAHHVSVAGSDPVQRDIDLETFRTMWDLSSPEGAAPACFLRLPQVEYYREEPNLETLKLMPSFRELPEGALVPEAVRGITYDTVNTDAPTFLNYLLAEFLASGGTIVRGSVMHINQVIESGPGAFASSSGEAGARSKYPLPDAVVVCLGLGARYLGGVEDTNVYPVRGQTVLLRAPWVKRCMSLSGGKDGIWTYVIPRRSGDVIVGGTYDANDWYSLPRPETTQDIFRRVLEICPELVPPEVRSEGRKGSIEDLLPIIVEENCGFRPCRKGGVRLEKEWLQTPSRTIPVVHNYGQVVFLGLPLTGVLTTPRNRHGGFGYIACYGSASAALRLLEEALIGR
ncbi:hypothetical protein CVT26_003900 [Gymnopilus dilepis]|uniref:FAD dependent oxidoreductase domain-containing protein n=1 Tax=Gymnopilus dilepis TaxID=231916 RepID=A0A409W6Y4_9AGAR|nr:hypothetical protein CVT26_003900 [Gymnopilus dilepis]